MSENSTIALLQDYVKAHPVQQFHIQMSGHRMYPTLRDGELLTLAPSSSADLKEGDIVLADMEEGLRVYRILLRRRDFFLLKGDALKTAALPVEIHQILGKVISHRPCPWIQRLWRVVKSQLIRWFSAQLCEMVLENQSREI